MKLAAAVYNNGGIYVSSNGGVTWNLQTGAPIRNWVSIASSADGTRLVAAVYSTASGLYTSQASTQATSTTGTSGFVSGGPGSPVSSAGIIWAN
jgi:hypothetical protein